MTDFTSDQRTANAPTPVPFGAVLRQFRVAAGLTQTTLAERAQMSARGIADLERGARRAPYPATLQRLVDALELSAADRARLVHAAWRASSAGSGTPATEVLHPVGVPAPLASLVGREREVAEIEEHLKAARLITLTGPGGVGKTRLAYEVARQHADEYADGTASVELAMITDAGLVAQAVASSLGVGDRPHESLLDTLANALRDRHVLLLLDNCEHVLAACAELADRLLAAAHQVQMLATSRAALKCAGEVVFEVSPLDVPHSTDAITAGQLARSDAARLFLHRTRAAQPRFVVSDANAASVAELCVRLDGLPLALELAAGRMRALGLDAIVERLDNRFRLLTGGLRTAASHQQTLLGTLDWSYGLLSNLERTLFQRLSVFVGGCDLDSLVAVCASAPASADDCLEVVSALVEQSLVVAQPDTRGDMRYRQLETIRAYASDRLTAAPEADTVRSRHAAVFLRLAEGADHGSPQWMARLDLEHANLRAAFRWFMDTGHIDEAVRLSVAMTQFWDVRGHVVEGLQASIEALNATSSSAAATRLNALVAASALAGRNDDFDAVERLVAEGLGLERAVSDPRALARLMNVRAIACTHRGDSATGRALHEKAVEIWRGLGDPVGLATTLNNLSTACDHLGDVDAARAALVECIDIARAAARGRLLANALNNLGLLLHRIGQDRAARPLLEESLAEARAFGDVYATANALGSLGLVLHQTRDLAAARTCFQQSLSLRRRGGDRRGMAVSLQNLASVLLDLDELAQASALLDESLALYRALGSQLGVADVLETMAGVAAARSDVASVTRLIEDAEATRRQLGQPRPPALQMRLDRWLQPWA